MSTFLQVTHKSVYICPINCFNKIRFRSHEEIVKVKYNSELEGKDLFIELFSLDHFIQD